MGMLDLFAGKTYRRVGRAARRALGGIADLAHKQANLAQSGADVLASAKGLVDQLVEKKAGESLGGMLASAQALMAELDATNMGDKATQMVGNAADMLASAKSVLDNLVAADPAQAASTMLNETAGAVTSARELLDQAKQGNLGSHIAELVNKMQQGVIPVPWP